VFDYDYCLTLDPLDNNLKFMINKMTTNQVFEELTTATGEVVYSPVHDSVKSAIEVEY